MTPKRAIEILEGMEKIAADRNAWDEVHALQLGIETLDLYQGYKENGFILRIWLLPHETPE